MVTFFIPLEAKTVAPQINKRHPRRRPIFYQNYQKLTPRNHDPYQANGDSNGDAEQFIIRGIEIYNNSKKSSQSRDEKKCDQHSANAIKCSACLAENNSLFQTNGPETNLCLDNSMWDHKNRMPDYLQSFSPHQQCTLSARRASSPATDQIIRITINSNKTKRTK